MQDLDQPELHHWFVKKAVTIAMDRHVKEREMTSCLLSSLYSVVSFTFAVILENELALCHLLYRP